MSDTQKFSITLPTAIAQRLDAMAAMSGNTRTDVIQRLIAQALAQNVDALTAVRGMNAQLSKELSAGLTQIREAVQAALPAGPQIEGEEINSGTLPPNLALLLIEIAARVTQPDKSKLEATRAAYRKTYLK
jgi:predicted DNA-binding protein